MEIYDTEGSLDRLHMELSFVEGADEETVKRVYNADSREDILLLVKEEIAEQEALLAEYDGCSRCPGIDYDALCSSLGLARFA